jgi:tetratricopeptide (TPR) repeat protein
VALDDIGQRFAEAEAAYHGLHYREALNAYTDCLKLRLARREGDQSPQFRQGDAVVVERLADLSMLFGWFEVAESLLSGLQGLFDEASNALASMHVSAKRIELALAAGEFRCARSALEALERWTGPLGDLTLTGPALARWEQGLAITRNRSDRDALLVAVYKVLGTYLSANGQFRDSLTLYERGLQHATGTRTDLASRFETPLYLGVAAAHIALGEIVEADQALSKADDGIREPIDPALRLQKLDIEARLAMLRGDFGQGLRRLETIEGLAREHDFIKAELLAALNYAHVLILVNHTEAARQKLSSALERAERIGDDALRRRTMALLQLTTLRGRSFVEGAPLAQTITEMQRAQPSKRPKVKPMRPFEIVKVEGTGSFIARFEDRALSLQWVLSSGDLMAAEAMLAGMQQEFGVTDSPLTHLRLGMLSGMIAYYAGSYAAALRLLDQVTTGFRQLRLVPDLWQALRLKGWCLTRLGGYDETGIATREEADRLLVVMTNSLRPIDRPVFLINKWSQQEELLAGQLDELTRLKSTADRSFWPMRAIRNFAVARRLDALLAHVDRYKRTLARQTVLEEAVESEPKNGHGLLKRLFAGSRREATIAFFVLPDRILVVLQRRGRLSFGISPVTRLALRESVRHWHLSLGLYEGTRDLTLASAPQAGRAGLAEIAGKLSAQILLPEILSSLPSRIARIRIIPDDALHGFPFAALQLGEKYLVERYAISIGYDLLPPPLYSARTRARQAVVAAVSRGARAIPPLPNAATEIQAVGGLLRSRSIDVVQLDSDHADQHAITAALQKAQLVHIACHGVFVPDAPDQSGLLLLPSPDKLELLSLRDLLILDLRGLRQITLSSCWSADNFVLPGRRVVSLPETLMRAGAESVIGSLWPLADEVALPLMTRLYHLLAVKGRAEALRQVQLEMIAGSLDGCCAADQSSPRHWAGITLFGTADRLNI